MSKQNPLNNMGNDSNRQILEFGNIPIENNAINFGQSALQISNIARTWIGKFEKTRLPVWTVIGLVIALALLEFGQWLVALIVGGVCGVVLFQYLRNRTDRFGLQIEMNSGFTAIFSSHDEQFLTAFQNAITRDFIGRTGTTTNISLENQTVYQTNRYVNSGIISYGNDADNTVNQTR